MKNCNSFVVYSLCFFICNCFGYKHSNLILYEREDGVRVLNSSDDANKGSDWLSEVTYANDINNTGYAYLEIKTNQKYTDLKQAYYAGYLEGTVTSDLIYSHWNNIIKSLCKNSNDVCTEVNKFLRRNTKWIKQNIKKHKYDPYWHHIGLYYTQLEGVLDGYNENTKSRKFTWDDVLWLNLFADIEDLLNVFNYSEPEGRRLREGHCSVLIKILRENEDLYFGHATWTDYSSMLRIQKKYSLYYDRSFNSDEKIPGTVMTFTGYPGIISSVDDFYLISSGLAATETTISNYNKSLWSNLKPTNCVFESVRSVVANRLADNGKTWTDIFSIYNSGTYNNQWMILDYKQFKPGRFPLNGTLWVIEQLPTKVVANDVTHVLIQKRYWSSYNRPYFKEIYDLAGYPEQYILYGNWLSYNNTPRANIFRRDQGSIRDMKSFMALMRSNDYRNDPYAKCDCDPPYSASGAISARHDLNIPNGTYSIRQQSYRPGGATDAKITNVELFLKLQFIAVSGPTTGTNYELPVFCWSTSNFTEIPHMSQPDCWNFEPVLHKWRFS